MKDKIAKFDSSNRSSGTASTIAAPRDVRASAKPHLTYNPLRDGGIDPERHLAGVKTSGVSERIDPRTGYSVVSLTLGECWKGARPARTMVPPAPKARTPRKPKIQKSKTDKVGSAGSRITQNAQRALAGRKISNAEIDAFIRAFASKKSSQWNGTITPAMRKAARAAIEHNQQIHNQQIHGR